MKLSKMTKEAIVRAIWNEVPEVDYKTRKAAAQAALVELFSPEVKAVYKKRPAALTNAIEYGLFSYEMPHNERQLVVADLTEEQIEEVLRPYREQDKARKEAHGKLTALVMGCNTRAQLLKLLPECEKYLPPEQSTDRSLPVVANVIADMTKLGWPKK